MSKAITITSPSGVTLKTKNKYMDDDVAISLSEAENILASNIKKDVSILGVSGTYEGFIPSGSVTISENGTYNISAFAEAVVSVPGLVPSGTLEISGNGVYDVGSYASANVNVQGGGVPTAEELLNRTISYYEGSATKIEGYIDPGIRSLAFQYCNSLSYVRITSIASAGNSRFIVQNNAFQGCSNLRTVNFFELPELYSSVLKYVTVETQAFMNCSNLSVLVSNVSQIGQEAFWRTKVTGLSANVLSDSYVWEFSVGAGAFFDCASFTELYIAATRILLNYSAFASTSLSRITNENLSCASDGYITVSNSIFANCQQLSYVSLSRLSYLNYIGGAFSTCYALESVRLEGIEPVTMISFNAFYGCSNLKSVEIGPMGSQLSIWQQAFYECSKITEVPYMSLVVSVANSAFLFAGIKSFVNSQTVTFGRNVFGYSGFKYLSVYSIVTANSRWFQQCWDLSYANVGTTSALQSAVFSMCSSLKSFLTTHVNRINNYAFLSCISLESVYLLSTAVTNLNNTNAFAFTPIADSTYLGYYGSLYVRASLLDSYKAATNWVRYSDRFVGLADSEMEQIITDYNNVSYIEE